MSYQVLALKYRPQTFADVVGQQHVTTTLVNALIADRMAHAVLFTGPRGTGKTTIARILAKAMNCVDGPTPTPCNVCRICKEITDGHCTDVFEIDGASNNSVDQVREIRENITYMPSSAKYKIYIIDEVHMLSTAAFNALLKTLEEPPAHVMFIFATTEVNKLPLTILSRCQRHDLARIPVEMIANHLMKLSEKEGFTIQKQSIDIIAREADGSVRDSLSLLDRILSSSLEKKPDHELILNALGVFDHRLMQEISSAIFEKDGRHLIELIEKVNDSGTDLKRFYSDLILHCRNLSILKICGQNTLAVNLSDFEKKSLLDSSENVRSEHMQTVLQILIEHENLVRYSSHTRTAVEMVMMKIMEPDAGPRLDYMIRQLDKLAKQILEIPPQDPSIKTFSRISQNKAEQDISSAIPYTAPENRGNAVIANKVGAGNDGLNAVISACPEDIPEDINVPEDSVTVQNIKGHVSGKCHDFLRTLENSQRYIFTLISNGIIKENPPDEIILELNNCSAFDKGRIEGKTQELEKICVDCTGKRLIININAGGSPQNIKNMVNDEAKMRERVPQTLQELINNNPLVMKAIKLFNAEII
jgi:DNA polymerase III subunit gamma/tau